MLGSNPAPYRVLQVLNGCVTIDEYGFIQDETIMNGPTSYLQPLVILAFEFFIL